MRTWPAYVGVIGGALVFLLILLPVVVWQYRRYGRLSGLRLLGSAAVAVYGVALVAYTLLPLPSGDLAQWCAQHGFSGPQLNPFQFVEDVLGGDEAAFGVLHRDQDLGIRLEAGGPGCRGVLHP